jgi:hypothetical protein
MFIKHSLKRGEKESSSPPWKGEPLRSWGLPKSSKWRGCEGDRDLKSSLKTRPRAGLFNLFVSIKALGEPAPCIYRFLILSTVNCLLSTVNCQLSTVNYQIKHSEKLLLKKYGAEFRRKVRNILLVRVTDKLQLLCAVSESFG